MEEEPMETALQSSPSLPPDPSAGGGGYDGGGGVDGSGGADNAGPSPPRSGWKRGGGLRKRHSPWTEVESRLPEGEGAEEAGGGAGE
jgi:hypothetical protein